MRYEYRKLLLKECVDNANTKYWHDFPMHQYTGSVATTRDLVALADYLQGPGTPIHFHGVSQASRIGTHLINSKYVDQGK